jgi:hypothetical protein
VFQFTHDFQKIVGLLCLPWLADEKQDIRFVVKNWLESLQRGDDWVVVLDNAGIILDFFPGSDEEAVGLAQFIPHGSKGAVIATTRDHEVAVQLADMNTLSKGVMSLGDADELFRACYPMAGGDQ